MRNPVEYQKRSGGTQVPREVVPGTAARHAKAAIPTFPRATVTRRTLITIIPAVLYPLPHVAAHVVQTQLIGPLPTDGMGSLSAVISIPADRSHVIAAGISIAPALPSAARRVLPLRFRRQTVSLAGQFVQFPQKYLDVVPINLLYGTPGAACERTWVVSHHRLPQRLRDLVLADLEAAHLHLVGRFFVSETIAISTALAAHGEAAAVHPHHHQPQLFPLLLPTALLCQAPRFRRSLEASAFLGFTPSTLLSLAPCLLPCLLLTP